MTPGGFRRDEEGGVGWLGFPARWGGLAFGFWGKALLNSPPGSMEARAYRPERDLQDRRDLGVVEIAPGDQKENLAVACLQVG